MGIGLKALLAAAVLALLFTAPPAHAVGLVAPPQIVGAPVEGTTLRAAPLQWDEDGEPDDVDYEWRRVGAGGGGNGNVVGRGSSYRLQSADVGRRIRLIVEWSDDDDDGDDDDDDDDDGPGGGGGGGRRRR